MLVHADHLGGASSKDVVVQFLKETTGADGISTPKTICSRRLRQRVCTWYTASSFVPNFINCEKTVLICPSQNDFFTGEHWLSISSCPCYCKNKRQILCLLFFLRHWMIRQTNRFF
ncbi:MAG: glycerol-3-phosphate responsive antiterminator [Angelakisella sp.]|nr:glycerol-3-phosphate responsive antiterminator [Angelakisella sp.]